MHRVKGEHYLMRGFDIVAPMMVAAVALSGSCFLDTATTLCESTGLRCSQGQVCAPRQGICVNAHGCGNGNLDQGEDCDDGDLINGNGCDSNCTLTGCGNGIVTVGEQCDEGQLNSDDGACLVNCESARCGDGKLHMGFEQCDDGQMNSDSASCLTNCQPARCGDGHVRQNAEVCDDGNDQACGTCSNICSVFSSARAFGYIFVYEIPDDRDWFILSDGMSTITFEYDFGNLVDPGVVPISLNPDSSVDEVSARTASEINAHAGLKVSAGISGTLVTLSSDSPGIAGNVTINKVATEAFSVYGMVGGTGGDCGTGVGCKSNADCMSNICLPDMTCQ